MTDHQASPTAPGITGLPLAPPPEDRAPAALRRVWSVRRRAAAAIAVLALAGSGAAVTGAGLTGDELAGDRSGDGSVDRGVIPQSPTRPDSTGSGGEHEHGETGTSEDSDES